MQCFKTKTAGGTKLVITTGSEGPRHDPYGYTEIEITMRNGVSAELHAGLGMWLRFTDSQGTEQQYDNSNSTEKEMEAKFEEITGWHPGDCENLMHLVEERRYAKDPMYGYDPYGGPGCYV